MFYIKIDSDGNPVNHPIIGNNLKQILEVAIIDADVLRDNGYAKFEYAPPAANGVSQQTQDYYVDIDGVVRNRVVTREFTQDELLDKFVRSRRSHLLAACDWTQAVDSPLNTAKREEWAAYRQALRDLTTEYSIVQSADDVVWPTEPTKA